MKPVPLYGKVHQKEMENDGNSVVWTMYVCVCVCVHIYPVGSNRRLTPQHDPMGKKIWICPPGWLFAGLCPTGVCECVGELLCLGQGEELLFGVD